MPNGDEIPMKALLLLLVVALLLGATWNTGCAQGTDPAAPTPARTRIFVVEIQSLTAKEWQPAALGADSGFIERRVDLKLVPIEVLAAAKRAVTNPPIEIQITQRAHRTGRVGDFMGAWSDLELAKGGRYLVTCDASDAKARIPALLAKHATEVDDLADEKYRRALEALLGGGKKPAPAR